jgi:hypothetical protein
VFADFGHEIFGGMRYNTIPRRNSRSFHLADAPATAKSLNLEIQDFRGDFDAVSDLIQSSWSENAQKPLHYSPEFLASCFEYPGASYALAPTMYMGDMPVAFAAGFPRMVRYRGRDLRVMIASFLSVSVGQKNKGYGVLLWNELVKRARAAGFDAMVNYCVDGEAMNAIIFGCCRMLKLATARFFSARYQMKVLVPKGAANVQAAPTVDNEGATVAAFLEGAQPVLESTPLARVWSKQEVMWQFKRYGSIVAQHAAGSRHGMITGYLMEIANPQRTRCLLIEDLLWGALEPPEREALLQQFLDRGTAAGAQMAIVPVLNYADMEPLRAARFRSSPRIVHGYLTVFSGEPAPEEVPAEYLDIF